MTTWAHNAIAEANCHGTLQLGGVSLNCPAWAVMNIASLWEPAPPRGENIEIPFRPGRLQVPRIRDERTDSLQILVVGTCYYDGTPTADPYAGLENNIDWLNDNLFAYATVMDPFDAVLTMPSGALKGGPMQLGTAKFGWEVGVAATVTVDYTLPDGQLAALGP